MCALMCLEYCMCVPWSSTSFSSCVIVCGSKDRNIEASAGIQIRWVISLFKATQKCNREVDFVRPDCTHRSLPEIDRRTPRRLRKEYTATALRPTERSPLAGRMWRPALHSSRTARWSARPFKACVCSRSKLRTTPRHGNAVSSDERRPHMRLLGRKPLGCEQGGLSRVGR